ncbi:unnamed protein product [Peniophora sp. CBMAI 1063]|nr:unnamed protein product [Peniophora sp. CBMAI 1063]
MRLRVPQHKALKGNRGAVTTFLKGTYQDFCEAFPKRVEEEKLRLAAARERAGAAATAIAAQHQETSQEAGSTVDGAEVGATVSGADDGAGTGGAGSDATAPEKAPKEVVNARKAQGKKSKANGDPSLQDRITTWFNNKRGVRDDAAVQPRTRGAMPALKLHRCHPTKPQVLMGVLGDEYNSKVKADYPDWLKTVEKDKQKTLIGYRNMRAAQDWPNQPPNIVEEVERIWKRTENAPSPPLELPVTESEELDDAARQEALRLATAQYYEDNINQLEPTCHKILSDMYRQTGLIATISFVGPCPGLGGQLTSFVIHTSIPGDQRTFQSLYPKYCKNVVEPFIKFGQTVFSPEVQTARALVPVTDLRSSTLSSMPPTAAASKAPSPAPTGMTIKAAKPKNARPNATRDDSSSESDDDIVYEDRDVTPVEADAGAQPTVHADRPRGTPTERARKERILENKKLMEELGLKQAAEALANSVKSSSTKPKARPKPKPKPIAPTSPRQTRSSKEKISGGANTTVAPDTHTGDAQLPLPPTAMPAMSPATAPTSTAAGEDEDAEPSSACAMPDGGDGNFVTKEMALLLLKMIEESDGCWETWKVVVDQYVQLERWANFPDGNISPMHFRKQIEAYYIA